LRLAEDIAVLDLLSGGRMSPVFAGGYRPAEFEMFGVGLDERRRLVNRAVEVCKRAWTGDPFEFEGRTVTVTPTPLQSPRPPITLGASVASIARQAAHIADGFDPAEPRLWDTYREECLTMGTDPGPWRERGPTFLYVTRFPDRAWEEVGESLMHAANTYAQWIHESFDRQSPWYPPIASVQELREGVAYRFVTPEQCIEIGRDLGPDGHLILRPLFGGIDPGRAWDSLELFERAVLPHLEVSFGVPTVRNDREAVIASRQTT
jgi:alkanesulfonate monooxygenase SsuD/methylene tetrahydromethanopterin reductase-like flavin-dependent oxidoreductase (luciferase family)